LRPQAETSAMVATSASAVNILPAVMGIRPFCDLSGPGAFDAGSDRL
jgi:hypothetical protein